MAHPDIAEFERLVGAYLRGDASWDDVHKFAVKMESRGTDDFPEDLIEEYDDLYITFLYADERDDPQFRLGKDQIQELLDALSSARRNCAPPSGD